MVEPGHLSIVDRFLAGMIQPMNLGGALQYMGLAPGEIGDDDIFVKTEGVSPLFAHS